MSIVPYIIQPSQVAAAVHDLARRLTITAQDSVFGIPRGGAPVALALALHARCGLVNTPQAASVIVDDIYDSGATAERYAKYGKRFGVLFDKRLPELAGKWIVLPWEQGETDTSAEDAVVRLLQRIGEDPKREGLRDTPARVVRAWEEWASGYDVAPIDLLKTFEDGAEGFDEMVIVHNIPVISKCEHHLADIIGHAHVGYIPNGRIVGLSKIARVVDALARRLQVQERLTVQIADAFNGAPLEPKGVGVLIRAAHGCMSTRGVKVHGNLTTTSAMRGALLDKPEARAEFLALCRDAERQGAGQ